MFSQKAYSKNCCNRFYAYDGRVLLSRRKYRVKNNYEIKEPPVRNTVSFFCSLKRVSMRIYDVGVCKSFRRFLQDERTG